MEQYTYIAHHGIRGMRWGIRNYQNEDGSLTTAGRLRYGSGGTLKSKIRTGLQDASYKARTGLRDARFKAFDTSIKARSALTDLKSAAYKKRRSAKDATYGLQRKLQEVSYKVGSKLGTQRAEAERLQRYVARLKWERIGNASVENLRRQRDYAKRVDAARHFIESSRSARSIASIASSVRWSTRTGVGAAGSSLTAATFDFLREHAKSRLKRAAPDLEMERRYRNTVESWRENQRDWQNSAENWWRIARGH